MSSPAETIATDVEQPPSASLVEPLLPAASPVVRLDERDPASGSVVIEQVVVDTELALNIDETAWEHGEVQGPSCRDWFWALLFLAQLAGVLVLAVGALMELSHGLPDHYHDGGFLGTSDPPVDRLVATGIVVVLGIAALTAVFLLLLVGPLASLMIQASLVGSPLACGLGSIGALVVGQGLLSGALALSCLLSTWYAVRVWHRIPFAAANLGVAMAALRRHKGLLGLSYVCSGLVVLWCAAWSLAVTDVFVYHHHWALACEGPNEYDDCHLTARGWWIVAGLAVSFFWVSQVVRNVFHTTVAGVVGTFWFAPSGTDDDAPRGRGIGWWCCCCCSPTLFDAWVRASVYSFGSICFGSLLAASLQVLQVLVRVARSQRDRQGRQPREHSLGWCLLQFLVDQLERLVEYVNAWAFVYVGLYGYDYLTSGSRVGALFRARGWSLVLNDFLVARSLGLMQLVAGILSGALAVLVAFLMVGEASPSVFCLGMVLGFLLASVQLRVVTSAVETVVVCFAEAPSALMENHSVEMASEMVRAWRRAYPNEFGA